MKDLVRGEVDFPADAAGDFILIRSDGFRDVFDVSDVEVEDLVRDEDQLLAFGMRFLNQVLFGEMTIPIRRDARERRIEKRKAVWAARRRHEAAKFRENLERQKYGE